MPNVNDMTTIKEEYSPEQHEMGGFVVLYETADEDGKFGFHHQIHAPEHTVHTTHISLAVQGTYDDMIRTIWHMARTGL